jgi:hypothetical protein
VAPPFIALDGRKAATDTRAMTAAALPIASPRSELLADLRGDGVRATWHADERALVLSLWREDQCRATVQLPPTEVARLATFLVATLGDALSTPVVTEAPRVTWVGRVRRFLGR